VIVRRVDGSWVLIRQVDHAAHAGRLTDAWKAGQFGGEQITASLREASARHDLGWAEADEEPRIDADTGEPSNFTRIDEAHHTDFYGRAVRTIAGGDPAAAYLVSLHASGLYSRRYGWSGLKPVDWLAIGDHGRALLDSERRYRATLASRLSPGEAEFEALWRGYMLLETFDFLSLLTCFGVESDGCGPVPSEPGHWTMLKVRRLGAWEVALDPYPFSKTPLVVPVAARRLEQAGFSSDAELRNALAAVEEAPQETSYRPM